MFLTHNMTYLNELNLHLQDPGQTVVGLFQGIERFCSKTGCPHGTSKRQLFATLNI